MEWLSSFGSVLKDYKICAPACKENLKKVENQIAILQEAAIQNENLFDKLMEATKVCSLGQITEALFKVGGQYRRNM